MILVRDVTRDDMPLVFKSWLVSYRHGNQALLRVPVGRYVLGQRRVINRLLRRGAEVRIACYSGGPLLVFGWACTEADNVVHYVYTKKFYRGIGCARALLGDLLEQPAVYTHETERVKSFIPPHWIYDPFRKDPNDENHRSSIQGERQDPARKREAG